MSSNLSDNKALFPFKLKQRGLKSTQAYARYKEKSTNEINKEPIL